ncbi:uncharacterized protein N7496_010755 [Penicillium cataractarum]|uniref:Ecp2 effector protein domain-containing protein n=1 Tax=Penicillium cataractarum TaxID=2100454 RepID=A0A9W9RDP1_9EURO|nr:uncharacterized protein N7496_010755 [Penicillium cataractarum]KAJ5358342.1 hypothetical protein N7496_010755 [Penicillium cataractarum]
MRFVVFLTAIATLGGAAPVPDSMANAAELVRPNEPLVNHAGLYEVPNGLEARGSTPWHDCKCIDGYITDETYSQVYEKTLAHQANFHGGAVTQGDVGLFGGPQKYLLGVEVVGKNSQVFSQSRVGNIIHQLKVARGDKNCGTKPVVCWTQGNDEIKAWVKQY